MFARHRPACQSGENHTAWSAIQQRTLEGLAAAREAGRKPGPKFKVTDEQWSAIRPRITKGEISIGQAVKILGLNKSTVSRRFNAGA